VYGLIAGMAELVADTDAVPGDDRLRLFPTEVADGRRGVGDATEPGFSARMPWILPPSMVRTGFGTSGAVQLRNANNGNRKSDFLIP